MTIGTIIIIVGVVLLVFLNILFKDNGIHGVEHEELFKEDLDFDPSWSVLSSNTHHDDDD